MGSRKHIMAEQYKAEKKQKAIAILNDCPTSPLKMRIVADTLLSRYGGRILNIHPSLLPAFPGARAVEQALNYGVKVFGVTIHYVDQTVDGGRIIAQRAVPYEGHDLDELFTLVHAAEHELYPATVARLLAGEV